MLKRSGFDTTAPLLMMVCLNVGEEVRGGYGGRRVTVVVVGVGCRGGGEMSSRHALNQLTGE